jgi:hypothetical protein
LARFLAWSLLVDAEIDPTSVTAIFKVSTVCSALFM